MNMVQNKTKKQNKTKQNKCYFVTLKQFNSWWSLKTLNEWSKAKQNKKQGTMSSHILVAKMTVKVYL